jgi:hypothetical protein
MLEAVFSMWSFPRCYKQEKFRDKLVVRQLPAIKDVKMETEEAAEFEAVTR